MANDFVAVDAEGTPVRHFRSCDFDPYDLAERFGHVKVYDETNGHRLIGEYEWTPSGLSEHALPEPCPRCGAPLTGLDADGIRARTAREIRSVTCAGGRSMEGEAMAKQCPDCEQPLDESDVDAAGWPNHVCGKVPTRADFVEGRKFRVVKAGASIWGMQPIAPYAWQGFRWDLPVGTVLTCAGTSMTMGDGVPAIKWQREDGSGICADACFDPVVGGMWGGQVPEPGYLELV